MSWWKRLRGWQKGAIILGGLHLLLSILLIQARTEGGGLILVEVALESPWLLLLHILGMESPANLLAYTYLPIIAGTIFYGFVGGTVWHIITRLKIKGRSP